jgi:hypothetical protein
MAKWTLGVIILEVNIWFRALLSRGAFISIPFGGAQTSVRTCFRSDRLDIQKHWLSTVDGVYI